MANIYGQSSQALAALDLLDSTKGCQIVSEIQRIGRFLEFDSGESQNDGICALGCPACDGPIKGPFSPSSSPGLHLRSVHSNLPCPMAVNEVSSHTSGILIIGRRI
jgi:hypothetical protein